MNVENLMKKSDVTRLKAKVLEMMLMIETDGCYKKENIKRDLYEVLQLADLMDNTSIEDLAS